MGNFIFELFIVYINCAIKGYIKETKEDLRMKKLSKLIDSAGILAIAAGVILFISGLITSKSEFMEDLYKTVGSIAEYLAIVAACLWLGRYVFTFLKKRKIGLSNYFPPVLKLLKKHHTVIGWAVLALASGHGVYFLFRLLNIWTESIPDWLRSLGCLLPFLD